MNARAVLAAAVLSSCSREPKGAPPAPRAEAPSAVPSTAPVPTTPPASPAAPATGFSEITWHYDDSPLGPSEVVVLTPLGATPETKLPVLVAFHGRGESLKGPKLGARGWKDDYTLGTTVERLSAPPLSPQDFLGFVTPERLARLNAALGAHPYRGMIVVCPFLPDGLHGDRTLAEGAALAGFVVGTVLPRVYRETPAIGTPKTTGVDGVSLGGRAALLVGLGRAEAFGAVEALQPAIDDAETPLFADLAKRAMAKNPDFSFRLVTSSGDYFLEPTVALSHAVQARGVPVTMDVVIGPHSYEWNRGPGGYEMLAFHDRALRGEPPP